LALAARLTEDVNISVLVLEAGEEKLDDPLIGECELVYSVSIGLTPFIPVWGSEYWSIWAHLWTRGIRLVFKNGSAKLLSETCPLLT